MNRFTELVRTKFIGAVWSALMLVVTTSSMAQVSGHADMPSYALLSSRWMVLENHIPVCWENPTSADSAQRALVQAAVNQTWERYSGVRFEGWGQCSPSSVGIRIRIADEWPAVKQLGNRLNGIPNGMVLNFVFGISAFQGCRTQANSCIEKIAIHEFGHALGLAHEQNRPDTPPNLCVGEMGPQGDNGDTMIGFWDLDSVMNYCNPKWNGNGKLSPTDIRAVRELYGNNDIYVKPGNNGTVTGDTFCQNLDGRDFGRRGICVAQIWPENNSVQACELLHGNTGKEVLALCTGSFGSTAGQSEHPTLFLKPGNNGTMSCADFCKSPVHGRVGTCLRQISPAAKAQACGSVNGYDGRGVLCACSP